MTQSDFWRQKIHIDKLSPIPLYYQMKQAILEAVRDGTLKEGDMIPSELDLCAMHDISRSTIRQTLSELVMEGYLTRQRAKGTVVAAPKIDARFLNKLQSYNEEMRQKGLVPSTRLMNLKVLEGVRHVSEKLRLDISEPLIYLERLRCADGEPLVYLETYIPYSSFPLLMKQDFTNGSLYEYMERLYDKRVSRVVRKLEAVPANAAEAQLLDIARGAPVCLVKTVAYTASGEPVEYSVARYRGDRNEFSVELYR
jgi:GntR family transcriptional regulator